MVDDDVCLGSVSNELLGLLDTNEIEPGAAAGYQTCKVIYLFHPLGGKMVDRPIKLAMYTPRTPVIENVYGIQDDLKTAFEKEWKALGADKVIANAARVSRIYGVGSVAALVDQDDPTDPLELSDLYKKSITFNVLDPLSTAGSILLDQDPNSKEFQHVRGIQVSGKSYHPSRCVVIQNEDPIYLAFNPASFGYTGRSVYQRALYPLKSFVQTMRTDDMIAVKAGLLVTKVQQASSIINNAMQKLAGLKNGMLKRGRTGEVLQIGQNDTIESLDLQNLDRPITVARRNILENIAAACDMPAMLLNSETFAQGLAEGSEDAKAIAQYTDDVREWLETLYSFFVRLCQYRAWNPEFFVTLQEKYGEELPGGYSTNFTKWINNFEFVWDESLKQSDAEQAKEEKVKFEAAEGVYTALAERLANDPENLAQLTEWLCETVNSSKKLFPQRLEFDYELMIEAFKKKPPDENQKTYIREDIDA